MEPTAYYTDLYSLGDKPVCFLKNFEKLVISSKPI